LKDPDTLGAPDQVGPIEDIKQRDPVGHSTDGCHAESSLRAEIDPDHLPD
jgi:hypothetical protein